MEFVPAYVCVYRSALKSLGPDHPDTVRCYTKWMTL